MIDSKRVAIVTGAASGIGRAAAQRLTSNGLNVVAIDRDEKGLASLREELSSIQIFPCDISDHAALERCVNETRTRFGRIDVLVNNAGTCFYERLTQSTLDHWRKTQAVNIEAMYVLAKLVAPSMIERKWGRIVNVASTQAIASEPTVGAYAASKGAICAWSRSLAVDLAEYGILVNVVAPGCVHTAMSFVDGVDETTTPLFKEWYVKNRKIPLARPAEPREIANVIAFLSGDECSYMTGATMVCDGGLTITF